jgi:hypothetical protein
MRMCSVLAVAAGVAAGSICQAQLSINFEPPTYNASAAGTLLTGQDAWYNPIAGSSDFSAYTYASNAFGIVANPTGGTQMIAGVCPGGTAFARAQHPFDFSAGGEWTVSWDVVGMFNGTLPAMENLGSFSLQPSTTNRYWQQLMNWGTHAADASAFDINYGVFDTTGLTIAFQSPGPAWQGLAVNHWYHQTTTWSFDSNLITEVTLTDLTTGVTSVANPVGWYLAGGPSSVLPIATDIRVFAGGSGTTNGNISAWDNIAVGRPAPRCGTADFNCDGDIGTDADIADFFACLSGTCPAPPCANNADFNGDGDIGTDSDIEAFFRVLSGGHC